MAYRIPLVTQSNAIHSPFSIALTLTPSAHRRDHDAAAAALAIANKLFSLLSNIQTSLSCCAAHVPGPSAVMIAMACQEIGAVKHHSSP